MYRLTIPIVHADMAHLVQLDAFHFRRRSLGNSRGPVLIQTREDIQVSLVMNHESFLVTSVEVSQDKNPVASIRCGGEQQPPKLPLSSSVHIMMTQTESYMTVGSRSYTILHKSASLPDGSSCYRPCLRCGNSSRC
jgi:hypothetical protein